MSRAVFLNGVILDIYRYDDTLGTTTANIPLYDLLRPRFVETLLLHYVRAMPARYQEPSTNRFITFKAGNVAAVDEFSHTFIQSFHDITDGCRDAFCDVSAKETVILHLMHRYHILLPYVDRYK